MNQGCDLYKLPYSMCPNNFKPRAMSNNNIRNIINFL